MNICHLSRYTVRSTDFNIPHFLTRRKYNLPIIADEIYGGCVFDGQFTSLSSVCGEVPVLVVGGV